MWIHLCVRSSIQKSAAHQWEEQEHADQEDTTNLMRIASSTFKPNLDFIDIQNINVFHTDTPY